MQNKFTIPVFEHLKKFAEKEFWENNSEPFFIDQNSILGKRIYALLIDRVSLTPLIVETKTSITITLSDSLAKRSPDLLKLSRVNVILEEMLKTHLVVWVKAQMHLNQNRYQAVISFLKYYDIHCNEMEDRYYQYVQRTLNIPFKIYHANKLFR